jgi:hypothetical protein
MAEERREARLRPEFSPLYPGVPPSTWKPAHELLDMVKASRLLTGRRSGEFLGARALDERHFEFRGGYIRPSGRHTRPIDF